MYSNLKKSEASINFASNDRSLSSKFGNFREDAAGFHYDRSEKYILDEERILEREDSSSTFEGKHMIFRQEEIPVEKFNASQSIKS